MILVVAISVFWVCVFTFIVILNGMDISVLIPNVHEVPNWDYIPLPTPVPDDHVRLLFRGF